MRLAIRGLYGVTCSRRINDGWCATLWNGASMADQNIAAIMNGSRQRWRTLRAQGFEWRDHELLVEAFRREIPAGATTFEAGFAGPPLPGREPWSLWVSLPADVRTEFQAGTETVTAVVRGSTWWSYSPSRGGISNEGNDRTRHGMGVAYPMTDPAAFSRALAFGPATSTTFVGRPALEVSAHAIDLTSLDFTEEIEADRAQSDLGVGAAEYRLHIDAERGIVLRSEARLEGRPFRIIEMEQISFDEELPDETFTLKLPPGTSFKSMDEWKRKLFSDETVDG